MYFFPVIHVTNGNKKCVVVSIRDRFWLLIRQGFGLSSIIHCYSIKFLGIKAFCYCETIS